MLPKVQNCVEALAGGVRRVHILNGMQPKSQLLASFIRPGIGTLIVPPPPPGKEPYHECRRSPRFT